VANHPHNAGRRVRALARLVGWQAWQRAVRKPLTVRLPGGGGRVIRCHPHSTAAAAVIYCGLPEWEDMRFLLAYLDEGDTFVDVGANVGVYTLLATVVDGVRVVAFEPSSRARARLDENVALNDLADRVTVRADAVGADEGEQAFTTAHDTVNHLLAEGEDDAIGGAEMVSVVTLDGAVGASGTAVAVVKIDVEGAEPDVLAGAQRLIAASTPAFIVEQNRPEALAAIFDQHGYTTCRYDPVAGRLVPCAVGAAPGNNVIGVRDLDAAHARLSRHRDRDRWF
jgi:FkbM family methyltransferase